ncbi:PREDICTED: uncharacterized protein LOC106344858 [Brassica oleracea var. oleracea]|uniref:uncharacterized protein LOC106344858 n=1 Tax=Brassica oleracea var. oleracea TaxID=109376 RepID=UPI0006A6F767|nr:PREDICTED: uncharacterized protein LOC106344858 [Brassica oleracea var. oleracea]
MDANLVEVMQGMSLEEDKSIVIPQDDTFCAMERGGRSLLGRLLNPECQNMARMLRTMPKIWKVYERVKGIALTRERFQFVFDLETDIQTVLKQGFWTFDDWGMAMERWVEYPPRNFLQTTAIWARLRNIPVNYLTLKTIDAIADGIGHVKVIEFYPEKPLLNDYVRVQVIIDLNQPIRDKKSLTLPGDRVEFIDVEYERIRKKCFHCLRLSHEKQRCPLLQRSKNKGNEIAVGQGSVQKQAGASRQHHNNLAEMLMPLLAPSVPPGFQPYSTVVAPEVFEQMRIYMSCVDPEERSLREAKMKKTLDELSRDPLAQRSCLRLETAPVTSMEKNGERGRVFDFRGVENREIPDISESSARRENRQHPALEMGSEYNNQQKEGTYAIYWLSNRTGYIEECEAQSHNAENG